MQQATKRIKYSHINLTQEMKDLYSKNYKIWIKVFEGEINTDILYSWSRRMQCQNNLYCQVDPRV